MRQEVSCIYSYTLILAENITSHIRWHTPCFVKMYRCLSLQYYHYWAVDRGECVMNEPGRNFLPFFVSNKLLTFTETIFLQVIDIQNRKLMSVFGLWLEKQRLRLLEFFHQELIGKQSVTKEFQEKQSHQKNQRRRNTLKQKKNSQKTGNNRQQLVRLNRSNLNFII